MTEREIEEYQNEITDCASCSIDLRRRNAVDCPQCGSNLCKRCAASEMPACETCFVNMVTR